MEKFNLYIGAAQRREAGDRIVGIVDMAVTIAGALGGGKAIKTHLEELEEHNGHGE